MRPWKPLESGTKGAGLSLGGPDPATYPCGFVQVTQPLGQTPQLETRAPAIHMQHLTH